MEIVIEQKNGVNIHCRLVQKKKGRVESKKKEER